MHVEWDGNQYTGCVNLGESLPLASNALVYMLVPLNSSWKVPVAYYLTAGLSGCVLANLTCNLLTYLHENGISVCALVCDGRGSNQSMLAELGVFLTYPLLNTSFPHPSHSSQLVSTFSFG